MIEVMLYSRKIMRCQFTPLWAYKKKSLLCVRRIHVPPKVRNSSDHLNGPPERFTNQRLVSIQKLLEV